MAVGPWWRHDGQDEIDAVALAGRRREALLVGEAKWSRAADGRRLHRVLQRKAARIAANPATLTYVLCAREKVADAPSGTVTVTAADISAAAMVTDDPDTRPLAGVDGPV